MAGLESIDSLQSEEQQNLLNEIDKLRAYGISEFVSLPQLVVCGDQSSGKSSVLEAITEVPFPRKDTLCTRFATEIVLRRSSTKTVLVKILPGSHRTETERKKLAEFSQTLSNDLTDLPALIDSATEAMGINPASTAFSRDVLSIEISGPSRPQLTIVDLPGLIHTENKSQTRADVELVSELCESYISNPRTIILAVVTAKNDYANQIILKRARDMDPHGSRTLGIITKPDTLSVGSEGEADFLGLAKNEDITFRLGWHVMRNRGFETRDVTFEERNTAEAAFFQQGVWKDLPRASVGVGPLRSRLSQLLLDHIRKELPKVFDEIQAKLRDCVKELATLGERRITPAEQRLFLSKLSQVFYGLCKAAIDGVYEDKFFENPLAANGYEKRLRAVVQNINISFARRMRRKGHTMEITKSDREEYEPENYEPEAQGKQHPRKLSPDVISETTALTWVKEIMTHSRGRELPGTFNPLLVGELFRAQSMKWQVISQYHIDQIWTACTLLVHRTLTETTNAEVFESLLRYHIDNALESRLEEARKELASLLNDRSKHAMTYNHYFTDNVQKARDWRYGTDHGNEMNRMSVSDMDQHACQEILDCMISYYKVALKTFVDNVTQQVIERRIVGELWAIFSPVAVATMDDKTISDIAGESLATRTRRTQLELQQERLRKGLEACRNALRGFKAATGGGGGEPVTAIQKTKIKIPQGGEEFLPQVDEYTMSDFDDEGTLTDDQNSNEDLSE